MLRKFKYNQQGRKWRRTPDRSSDILRRNERIGMESSSSPRNTDHYERVRVFSSEVTLLIACLVLVPFQTFSVVADFLKNIAIESGPAVAGQLGFASWQREAITFSYQFGTLIVPTVVPAIVWVLMHRRFLESFMGRDRA